MTDTLPALLLACRADPADTDTRGVMRDRVLDEDGDTPAAAACLALVCERCGVPDSDQWMTRDLAGRWWTDEETGRLNSDAGYAAFGGEPPHRFPGDAVLTLYRGNRWHLVCPPCRRSLIAERANATRRRNREAAPNLFTGLD